MNKLLLIGTFIFLYTPLGFANSSYKCLPDLGSITKENRALHLVRYKCHNHESLDINGFVDKKFAPSVYSFLGPMSTKRAIISGEIVCFNLNIHKDSINKIKSFTNDFIYCDKRSTLANNINKLKEKVYGETGVYQNALDIFYRFPLLGSEDSETISGKYIPAMRLDLGRISNIVSHHNDFYFGGRSLMFSESSLYNMPMYPHYKYNAMGRNYLSKFRIYRGDLSPYIARPKIGMISSYQSHLEYVVSTQLAATEYILRYKAKKAIAKFRNRIEFKSIIAKFKNAKLFVFKERLCALTENKYSSVMSCKTTSQNNFSIFKILNYKVDKIAAFNNMLCFSHRRKKTSFHYTLNYDNPRRVASNLKNELKRDEAELAKTSLSCLSDFNSRFFKTDLFDRNFTKNLLNKVMTDLKYRKRQSSDSSEIKLSLNMSVADVFYSSKKRRSQYCFKPKSIYRLGKVIKQYSKETTCVNYLRKNKSTYVNMSFPKGIIKKAHFMTALKDLNSMRLENKASSCSNNTKSCCYGYGRGHSYYRNSRYKRACYARDLASEVAMLNGEREAIQWAQTALISPFLAYPSSDALKSLARRCLLRKNTMDRFLCKPFMPMAIIGLKIIMYDKKIRFQQDLISRLHKMVVRTSGKMQLQVESLLFQKLLYVTSLKSSRQNITLNQYSLLGAPTEPVFDPGYYMSGVLRYPYRVIKHRTPHMALYAGDFFMRAVREAQRKELIKKYRYFYMIAEKRSRILRETSRGVRLGQHKVSRLYASIDRVQRLIAMSNHEAQLRIELIDELE